MIQQRSSAPLNDAVWTRCLDLASQQRLDVTSRVADEVLRALELDGQALTIAPVLIGERAGATGYRLRKGIPFGTHFSFHE